MSPLPLTPTSNDKHQSQLSPRGRGSQYEGIGGYKTPINNAIGYASSPETDDHNTIRFETPVSVENSDSDDGFLAVWSQIPRGCQSLSSELASRFRKEQHNSLESSKYNKKSDAVSSKQVSEGPILLCAERIFDTSNDSMTEIPARDKTATPFGFLAEEEPIQPIDSRDSNRQYRSARVQIRSSEDSCDSEALSQEPRLVQSVEDGVYGEIDISTTPKTPELAPISFSKFHLRNGTSTSSLVPYNRKFTSSFSNSSRSPGKHTRGIAIKIPPRRLSKVEMGIKEREWMASIGDEESWEDEISQPYKQLRFGKDIKSGTNSGMFGRAKRVRMA